MQLPEGFSVRPARRDDAEAITKMLVDIEMSLLGQAESTIEDLYDDWTNPGFDMDRDTWVVFHEDELAGYSSVVKFTPPGGYSAYGGVAPSYVGRGIGTYLFEVVEERVREKGGAGATVRQWVDTANVDAIKILRERGYSFARKFSRMSIVLPETVDAPRSIEGVTIRGFEKGIDERPAHDALEEGFKEHYNYSPKTYEDVAAQRWEAEWFRPDLSYVAVAGGKIVGVCINSYRLDEGFVDDLAVIPAWRGKGIAKALLLTTFLRFKELGAESVGLSVDTDNTTGAVRLYERVGMTNVYSYEVYERALDD